MPGGCTSGQTGLSIVVGETSRPEQSRSSTGTGSRSRCSRWCWSSWAWSCSPSSASSSGRSPPGSESSPVGLSFLRSQVACGLAAARRVPGAGGVCRDLDARRVRPVRLQPERREVNDVKVPDDYCMMFVVPEIHARGTVTFSSKTSVAFAPRRLFYRIGPRTGRCTLDSLKIDGTAVG